MMETELSRITWDDLIILDCLNPFLYQFPVWRNGFRKSLPSSFSSLKLILNLQSATQVFVKMLKDGVFWIVGVLNAEIHRIIHPKLPFSPWESFQVFFFLEFWFFGFGCFFVSFWAKDERFECWFVWFGVFFLSISGQKMRNLLVIFGIVQICNLVATRWSFC